MTRKLLILAFILLLVIPSALAGNPKTMYDLNGRLVARYANMPALEAPTDIVKDPLMIDVTGGKYSDDILTKLKQFVQIMPLDLEGSVIKVNGDVVGILPKTSKFIGVIPTSKCVTVYQYGTDGWYTCELSSEKPVSPTIKPIVVETIPTVGKVEMEDITK